MRTTDVTLTAAQKAVGTVLCKVVLTSGVTTKTYSHASTDRILSLKHTEQEWSQVAQVSVQDSDGTLAALALQGYTGVISYGFNTTDGDEYSAAAPLTVISQSTASRQGSLVTSLGLAGLFNLWGEQEAPEAYAPDRINTDTVKTILDAIAAPAMTCFSGYPAHTITYDSGYDDSIINAFTPADAFSVAKGESRLSAFKKALAYTKCTCRVENDSGTATIHIFQPTTTGTSYDYEYNDAIAAANHNFFNKSTRKRLVLPNKVTVMNHPDHTDSYTGSATDADSYAALGNQYYTKTVYCRPADNTQAALIAAGILLKYQLAAERGHGFAPMNVYQEVLDYVKITDSRVSATDSRVGNIGLIERTYEPNKFVFEFRFGALIVPGLAGTLPPRAEAPTAPTRPRVGSLAELREAFGELYEAYVAVIDEVQGNRDTILQLIDYLISREGRAEFTHLSVTGEFLGPMGANKYT